VNALILRGGWEKHAPTVFADWIRTRLENQGDVVTVTDTLGTLLDATAMSRVDVIVPIWSSMGSGHDPSLGNLTREQEDALVEAVENGVGLAGWHGHMGDAFRDRPTYKFLAGSQFVGHPPGWPDRPIPEEDFITYRVNIAGDHPIVAGLKPFDVHSEQYYLHVDPAIDVHATTTFSGEHLPWLDGVVMPVTYTKRWGQGKVFYCSIGHDIREFEIPEVAEMITRGVRWAGRPEAS
jgi:type 1 glutamine amidotransferase